MFWKFQEIHEQLFLKDKEKLEALSETVQKIHDLKKASVRKIHAYYPKHQASIDIIRNISKMVSLTWEH